MIIIILCLYMHIYIYRPWIPPNVTKNGLGNQNRTVKERICCNKVLLPTCLIIPSKRSPRYSGPWMCFKKATYEILHWCIMYEIVLNFAGTCVSGWCDPCWPLCWGGQLYVWSVAGFNKKLQVCWFLGPEVGVELFAYAPSASLPWIDAVWTRVF